MDTPTGIPQQIGPDFSPLILPMRGEESQIGAAPTNLDSEKNRPTARVKHFSFPAIPTRHGDRHGDSLHGSNTNIPANSNSLLKKATGNSLETSAPFVQQAARAASLRAIWPRCDCEETRRACIALAETIRCGLPSGRPAIVALTSPGDGDGKTTLAAALAPELAHRTPGGVLAIDADYRKADLTSRLTLSVGMPVSDSPLIYPTDMSDLSVLTMSPGRPMQCLQPSWMNALRERWPLTLLDTASMEHAETTRLLPHCDAVCLVVRLGYTLRRAVAEAARVIAARGGNLLGCVIVGRESGE